jgi:C4-dicarboxylate-specific signal transduction histidine kinase
MVIAPSKPGPSAPAPPWHVARTLSSRYLLILAVVALILAIDQAVLQPRLVRLGIYAPRINIAGRQRMLSQKLVKTALAMNAEESSVTRDVRRKELRETLDLWQRSQLSLLEGNPELGLPRTSSPGIRQAFVEMAPHFDGLGTAAAQMIDGDESPANVATLLEQESKFLPQMDRIVGMYEAEAGTQATTLRFLGALAATSVIALLIAIGRIVLVPATRTIQTQLEVLEEHVAVRTAELTAANRSLKHEMEIRQQAEERTRKLSDQLSHTARVETLGQFATGLAHEINQPLAAIVNYAELSAVLLKKESVDVPELRQAIGNIGQAAMRAGEIVRGMRNFLRPGQSPVQEVRLQQLIHDVVVLCSPEIRRRQVRLELDLPSDDCQLHVAPIQIQQVLLNLIQNALQAMEDTPPDDRTLRLHVEREPVDWRIEIVDTGRGFGEHDPATLFEPFLTTKPSGLGMGLAIVRSIIQEYGGHVWAESRPRGAAVCFTLPLTSQHDQPASAATHCVCG